MLFRHLPFYAKYGAIPESYLIALSYEEQLLWLCKKIEDLDSNIFEGFEEFKEYVNESLDYLNTNKQDKLEAGDNIVIDGNVISSFIGKNFTPQITPDITYGSYDVGATLPHFEVLPSDSHKSAIEIIEHETADVYDLKGNFTIYEIDTDTREILRKDNGIATTDYYVYNSTGGRTLAIDFYSTDEYTPRLIREDNLDFSGLQEQIDELDENKQDKLTAGVGISIDENNVISGLNVNYLTSNLVFVNGTSPSGYFPKGFYYTNTYGVYLGSETIGNLVFGAEELLFFDDNSLTFVGSLKSFSYSESDDEWHILDNHEIENTLTNDRTKIPTSYAVYQAIQSISPSGTGVTKLTHDILYTSADTPIALTEGFYDTDSYVIGTTNGVTPLVVFGNNEIVFVTDSGKTFIGGMGVFYYDESLNDWLQVNASAIENTLSQSTNKVPSSYAVYQALQNIQPSGSGLDPVKLTSEITDNYYIDIYNADVGDTISLTPVSGTNVSYYIQDVNAGDEFNIEGNISVALIDSNNEVVVKANATSTQDTPINVKVQNANEKLVISWWSTNTNTPSLEQVMTTSYIKGIKDEIDNYKPLDVYSTTEQRVGTWIDGKPLYRLVLQIPSLTISSNVATITGLPADFFTNLGEICFIDVMIGTENTNWKSGRKNYLNSSYYSGVQFSSSDIKLYVKEMSATKIKCSLIIEYTKSTN